MLFLSLLRLGEGGRRGLEKLIRSEMLGIFQEEVMPLIKRGLRTQMVEDETEPFEQTVGVIRAPTYFPKYRVVQGMDRAQQATYNHYWAFAFKKKFTGDPNDKLSLIHI